MNRSLDSPIADDRLKRVFVRSWPDFADRLAMIPESAHEPTVPRDERSLLEEILSYVRSLDRQISRSDSERLLAQLPAILADDMQLDRLKQQVAYKIGTGRKLNALDERLRSLLQGSERVHQVVVSTAQEMAEDWSAAERKVSELKSDIGSASGGVDSK